MLVLLVAAAPAPAAVPGDPPLEEIVVTASLRPATLPEFPASVTVLDAGVLRTAGLQHLQDVMGLVPNLNWSGGTSRPRYFLLRGVGELEQYQGAPNPSVGFLIDDIDFSGVGMPATSFDLAQVEVLRGPQGTRYGANALAGLINVRSQAPRPETELHTELSAGEDGLLSAGLVAGGALPGGQGPEGGAWRVAMQQSTSDGFRRNTYLGRDDTNGRDELTLRGRVHLEPAEGWDLGLTVLHADLDNGFDAFVPDNGFDTLSDRPGRDAQTSSGAALRLTGRLGPGTLQSTTALADSDVVYSFDGDWGNDPYWEPYVPYDYFSRYDRERRTLSQDLRLVSASSARDGGHGWLVGAYAQRLDEENLQRDEFAGELLRPLLATDYRAVNAAVYGEVERAVGGLVLSGGLRLETRSADYGDSDGAAHSPRDTMWGGQLALAGEAGARGHWYLTASRGYKAGGFNIGALVPVARREFEPEYLWNLEAGLRGSAADGLLTFELALFHMWREAQQVATSFQVDPGDPLSYVYFTDNAARGRNAGLEATLAWQALPDLALGATLGLLHSEYLGYQYGDHRLDGREQAHAPGWQYSLSAEWNAGRGWMARADLAGSDAFYFDASHDQRSRPYALLNLKAGYASGRWAAYAWGRNVTDEHHAVRGFYFGLEPPDYVDRLYVQQGDPRQFGLTLQWSLR